MYLKDSVKLLIIGRSGSGKDSIVRMLCDKYGFKNLLSYTTRAQRESELDNPTHTHVSEEEVPKDIKDVLAYANIYGVHYWATSEQLDDCDIYVVDPNSIEVIKEKYKKHNPRAKIVSIAIVVDEENLIERMQKRGDLNESIRRKFEEDKIIHKNDQEMVDLVVYNNKTVSDAVNTIIKYLIMNGFVV